jgi:uridine kinase
MDPLPDKKYWIILIGGGHAAGKKDVCHELETALSGLSGKDFPIQVRHLHMEKYQRERMYDPSKLDFERLLHDLGDGGFLSELEGIPVEAEFGGTKIRAPTVIIVEGEYALYDKRLRDKAIMKVFVEKDADTRLSQWILRDTDGDRTKLGSILDEYLNRARPEMNEYIMPTKQYADVILPGLKGHGTRLIATGVYDRIREEFLHEPHQHLTITLKGGGIDMRRPGMSLKKEAFVDESERFYVLS